VLEGLRQIFRAGILPRRLAEQAHVAGNVAGGQGHHGDGRGDSFELIHEFHVELRIGNNQVRLQRGQRFEVGLVPDAESRQFGCRGRVFDPFGGADGRHADRVQHFGDRGAHAHHALRRRVERYLPANRIGDRARLGAVLRLNRAQTDHEREEQRSNQQQTESIRPNHSSLL